MEKVPQLFNPDELVCSVCGCEVDIAHIDLNDVKHQDTPLCAAFEIYRENGLEYIVESMMDSTDDSINHTGLYTITGIESDDLHNQFYKFIGNNGKETKAPVEYFFLP